MLVMILHLERFIKLKQMIKAPFPLYYHCRYFIGYADDSNSSKSLYAPWLQTIAENLLSLVQDNSLILESLVS